MVTHFTLLFLPWTREFFSISDAFPFVHPSISVCQWLRRLIFFPSVVVPGDASCVSTFSHSRQLHTLDSNKREVSFEIAVATSVLMLFASWLFRYLYCSRPWPRLLRCSVKIVILIVKSPCDWLVHTILCPYPCGRDQNFLYAAPGYALDPPTTTSNFSLINEATFINFRRR